MELRPGLRLESAACDTQVVVVKAPKDNSDVDLRCGGHPMRAVDSGGDRVEAVGESGPTLLGKRYSNDDLGLEVLCTQGGSSALSVGDEPLLEKGAKPLPSSD